MKKIVLVVIASVSVFSLSAQNKKKIGFTSQTGDHFMLQFTSDHWMGSTPDSIKSHMKGFARGLNVYVMLDQRFKSNPKLSVAFGLGVSSSNIYFKNMNIDLKSKTSKLPFSNLDTLNHFKKYKLATAFLEVPIELRFSSDPANDSKSIKAAVGFKVGTIINAHTKGKNLQDAAGRTINSYTEKESARGFFNSTRIVATARVGYGNFSLVANYQLNNIFKDGVAPDVKLFQIGLCVSGL